VFAMALVFLAGRSDGPASAPDASGGPAATQPATRPATRPRLSVPPETLLKRAVDDSLDDQGDFLLFDESANAVLRLRPVGVEGRCVELPDGRFVAVYRFRDEQDQPRRIRIRLKVDPNEQPAIEGAEPMP